MPLSGRTSPVSTDTKVDLPAPFRPTKACVRPAVTLIPTSRNATVEPNSLPMWAASTSGGSDGSAWPEGVPAGQAVPDPGCS